MNSVRLRNAARAVFVFLLATVIPVVISIALTTSFGFCHSSRVGSSNLGAHSLACSKR